MKTYKMWIGGEWVDAQSGKSFTVVESSYGRSNSPSPPGRQP